MAEMKKTATAKTAGKTEETAPVAKELEVKEAVEEAVVEEAKPATRKRTVRKTTEKKAAEKKTAKKAETKPATRRTAKAAAKAVISLQFAGKSYSTEDIQKMAEDVWKYDLQKDGEAYKSLELYVKPEENMVYYVFDGEIMGSFQI